MDITHKHNHKVNKINKATICFRIYHQNIRELRKKACELLSHLHPDFPHVLSTTEHQIKYLRLNTVHIENYNLGACNCRQLRELCGAAGFVHNSLYFSNIDIVKHCAEQNIEICAEIKKI